MKALFGLTVGLPLLVVGAAVIVGTAIRILTCGCR